MVQMKLISDKIIKKGKTIIYNRRIIRCDSDKNKTPEEKYKEENIKQFYDFINPNVDLVVK